MAHAFYEAFSLAFMAKVDTYGLMKSSFSMNNKKK